MLILKLANRLFSLVLLLSLSAGLVQSRPARAAGVQVQAGQALLSPQVRYPVHYDLSEPLRTMPPLSLPGGMAAGLPARALPKTGQPPAPGSAGLDLALQTIPVAAQMPATGFNFEGLSNVNGVLPPDTNGDVSATHYVQWVNLSLAIWSLDRSTSTASLVYGPVSGNTLWSGFGGACQFQNDGDPIVLYDHLADRWLLGQFALPNFPYGPFYQCIAVSQTGDPTGSWHRYAFLASPNMMNDYPHLGVWPDGYYMSANQFNAGTLTWAGAGAWVFERSQMLLGQGARMVYFDLYNANSNYGGMLPSDLDGPAPPAGTPNYFAEVDDSTWISPVDALRIWEFKVNWVNPTSSTFGLSGQPNTTLSISNFLPLCIQDADCVPQPGTSRGLDAIGDRLMHRLQYRNFGSYATLVTNHTVDAGGGRAGVRWYELRNSIGGWSIQQQGTYAGDGANSAHRWMGSAAMDGAGNVAIGYSLSSSSTYPSIAYTGRLAGDPPNTLPQGEAILMAGAGSQTHEKSRWGDYSMLGVDPSDGCTFWFTSEYLQATSTSAWFTRVGSFTFPSCLASQTGALEGVVKAAGSGQPLQNALVEAGGFSSVTDQSGLYQFASLPVGTYTLKVTRYGYTPASASGVTVVFNQTTKRDFSLAASPATSLSGTVTDGSGHGWPLYARIDINAQGYANTIFSNPATGDYSLSLAQGSPVTFNVQAISGGYLPHTSVYTPTQPIAARNFALQVDSLACSAPGYSSSGGCNPVPGGLVVGNVYDANLGIGLNGATITRVGASGELTTSFSTPDDPAVDDGFYTLFSSATGLRTFNADRLDFGTDTRLISILADQTVTGDFYLPAGWLQPDPDHVRAYLTSTQVVTRLVSLQNSGAYTASFNLSEVNAPTLALIASGPFAIPTRHVSPKRLADLDAASVYEYTPPAATPLPGGELLQSWSSGLVHPWGIGFDAARQAVWIGNPAAGGGDDRLYRYAVDGLPGSTWIDLEAPDRFFSADLAFDPFRKTFWQVAVGGQGCIFEIDPQQGALTGRQICPSFDTPQRGLAFNPLDQTFYSGSWTNGILYHFDQGGRLLDSFNTGLNISGLAYNPSTNHLFVLSNAAAGYDLYVLLASPGYPLIGGFDIPGLEAFEQAGLDIDCAGRLWIVNQVTGLVSQVNSGEGSACAYNDVPWLDVSPLSGVLPGGAAMTLTLRLDAGSTSLVDNHAQIFIANDTPYGALTIPVTLTVKSDFNFDLSALQDSLTAAPGSTLTYTLQITNTGFLTDSYQVSASGNLWTVSLPSQVGPLSPDGNTVFNLSVAIPPNAHGGAVDVFEVMVASLNAPGRFAKVSLTARATHTLFLPYIGKYNQ